MINIIERDSLDTVKNEALRKDIEFYIDIYEQFMMEFVKEGMQIAESEASDKDKLANELKSLGVNSRNSGKSFIWGAISPSCEDCRTGDGSSTYIVSLKCNRDCFFCTNKNQHNYSCHNDNVNNIVAEFDADLRRFGNMRSAGITGGEPLLFMDECISFIKHVKSKDEKINVRIYTNGDLATEESLKRLGEAGLDEIRFGLKPDESGNVEEILYSNLENAVKYIPRAMVEMPCLPEQLESMKSILDRLENIGIYGINILEFLFPWVHADEYAKHGYKISRKPYRVLFDYDYAGGVSVAGSEICCMELLKYAAGKKFKMGVHYCSLENKLTAQVWQHNHRFNKTPLEFFSENDFFVKKAKAYSGDARKVKAALDEKGVANYTYDRAADVLEFSVFDIPRLKGLEVELGISVMILDYDAGGTFIREIAVHHTDSEIFSQDDL